MKTSSRPTESVLRSEINDYRKLREGGLGDVQDVERISPRDTRKYSDEVRNGNIGRSGYNDRNSFGGLSATPARDARGRARTIVLILAGEFETGTWLPGDDGRHA